MDVIKVDKMTKDYGSGRGIFNVSLHVEPGEVFGFLGPNGAGKSTTIRHLMGFSAPDSGSASIFGRERFGHYYEFLGRVGYIPGEVALPRGLTGSEFISMMQSMQGVRNDAKLKEMLSRFELDKNTLKQETKRMSLGVKRKLAVVTAFMHDPEVLVLDEPTSGLDPVMQESFIDYIHAEKHRGKTVLLSSHIFSEIDSTCDRIAIIKDGRIVSDFVADELKHASKKFYTVTFASPAQREAFLKRAGTIPSLTVMKKDAGGQDVYMSVEDTDMNAVIALLSDFEITGFSNRRESLEDYFMKFYKEDKDFGGAL